jgi:predicted permease
MRGLRRWQVWARSIFQRSRVESEMRDELRLHLEDQVRENLGAGMSPREARRQARLAFGDVDAIAEECRDEQRLAWLEGLWHDLRHAARSLRRSPGLVFVSVLSFALGIGLNTALFSGLQTVYGHRPTMGEPDGVVGLEPGNGPQLSYLDLRDLDRSGVFAGVTGFRTTGLDLRSGERRERLFTLAVMGNYFDVLGIGARLGRTFTATEAELGREPRLVVLSHDFWRRRFAGDPGVIGRELLLDGEPFVVVGVLGRDHRAITGFAGPQIYVPLSRLVLPSAGDRSSASLTVLARLAPGSSLEQARARTQAMFRDLEKLHPPLDEGLARTVELFPAETIPLRGTPAGFSFFGVVLGILFALVLFIAAANVAGLLLARGAQRHHELAIHLALGAGRRRLVQGLLVESLLLSLLGGATGIGVALLAGRFRAPGHTSMLQSLITPSAPVLLYGLLLVIGSALLAGLAPALVAVRREVPVEIRACATVGTSRPWLRGAFVVGQIAMSVALLAVAGLCLRSQLTIGGLDLGFDLEGGLVARFRLAADRDSAADRRRVAEQALARAEALADVLSASVADLVPLGGDSLVASFHPAGRTDLPGARPSVYSVGARYFETLGIGIVRGRDFEPGDDAGSPPVVIVNETYVLTHFPNRPAIGQRVQTVDEPDAEVVGVVRDSKIDTLGEAPQSVLYFPYAQRPRALVLHLRTAAAPATSIPAVTEAIGKIDGVARLTVETRAEAASLEMSMRRSATVMLGAIGGIGLLLTLIGLYGIMAFLVLTRVPEVGLRMALGASPGRMRWEVLRQALLLLTAGVGLGSLGALLFAPGLAVFLAGSSPFDPVSYGGTILILLGAGLAASWIPARRATRVSPLVALRHL